MSTHIVEITPVLNIEPHPNADRLEIATVKGWQCVVGKGQFQPGDLCVYIPIDSILPENLLQAIFGNSKIKPTPRVKTIKLRGAISQGIACDPNDLGIADPENGQDVAQVLGITKYEPPVPTFQRNGPKTVSPKQVNPHFHKYTGIENAKNYPNVFEDGEDVVVTEKIHGTNFRAGYVPNEANTFWKKVKKFFGLLPKYEFVYGSHNVQLQNKLLYNGFYKDNVYAEAVDRYNLKEVLKPGEVVYGEIYGDGIQKGYSYGCDKGKRKLVLFDVMIDDHWLDPIAFQKWADSRMLPQVPVLFKGPFDMAQIKTLTKGDSVMVPSQKVREGVVVKAFKEQHCYIGRKMLKFISDEYLLRDQTDFH